VSMTRVTEAFDRGAPFQHPHSSSTSYALSAPPLRGGGKPRIRCAWYPLPHKGEGSPGIAPTSLEISRLRALGRRFATPLTRSMTIPDTVLPRQIIERHGPEPERQIRLEMQCGDNLAHRQPCDIRQRVREQAERGGAGPGLLQGDVLEMVAHELADPRAAVDMGNDLENEVRHLHALQHRVVIDLVMLVAHGAGGAEHGAVMQRADQHVALDLHLRARQLLRKAPELAPAGDRALI